MGVVLAGASFASFVFFWSVDLPLKGQSALHGYRVWLGGLTSGRSFRGQFEPSPLWPTFAKALEHTLVLIGGAVIIVVPICVLFAACAVWRRDGVVDTVLRTFAYAAWAVPPFLLALLVTLWAVSFGNHGTIGPFGAGGWPGGACVPGVDFSTGDPLPCPPPPSALQHAVDVLRAVALPALVLAAGFVGVHSRQLRAGLLQTMGEPFVRTARAKGLSETRILFRHSLRSSIATFSSGLLADVGAIFGAALAVDAIFQLGGLGTLLLALFPRVDGYVPIDIYAVQMMLLLTGVFVLASTLLADGVVSLLDPRLRRGKP
jgi:peptide/nickel transport system permease protein